MGPLDNGSLSDKERFEEKDREFARLAILGNWPANDCSACAARGGCCRYVWHHVGDCCTHCGLDERGQ